MQQLQLALHQQELQVSSDSLFMLVLYSTYLLECPGFTLYLLIALPVLPIPRHGLLKDLPSFVTVCTSQGLAVKATCMQDCRRRISPACIGRELLPFQFSTLYLCTTWPLYPKALALSPGFCIAVVPLLSVLKAWLLQGLAWLLPWMPKLCATFVINN